MESSPAVAGNTIQYTAIDYCKGRAEKGRVSHRVLPAHLQLSLLPWLNTKGHCAWQWSTLYFKGFPKAMTRIRTGIFIKYQILRLQIKLGTFWELTLLFSSPAERSTSSHCGGTCKIQIKTHHIHQTDRKTHQSKTENIDSLTTQFDSLWQGLLYLLLALPLGNGVEP